MIECSIEKEEEKPLGFIETSSSKKKFEAEEVDEAIKNIKLMNQHRKIFEFHNKKNKKTKNIYDDILSRNLSDFKRDRKILDKLPLNPKSMKEIKKIIIIPEKLEHKKKQIHIRSFVKIIKILFKKKKNYYRLKMMK